MLEASQPTSELLGAEGMGSADLRADCQQVWNVVRLNQRQQL